MTALTNPLASLPGWLTVAGSRFTTHDCDHTHTAAQRAHCAGSNGEECVHRQDGGLGEHTDCSQVQYAQWEWVKEIILVWFEGAGPTDGGVCVCVLGWGVFKWHWLVLAGAGAGAAELNLFATSYFFFKLRMTGIEKRRRLNKTKKAQQAKKPSKTDNRWQEGSV